ncbi:MAG TPA: BTAD domain-containing putative transcriptional regulator [Rhodopila sp.]
MTGNNKNVLPPGRKTRALLARIAMGAPRPALRSRLAEQLWSRSPEEHARASLRQEIHRLLDALSPVETSVLIVTRDHLAVRTGAVSTDLQEVAQPNSARPAVLSLFDADLLEGLDGIDPNFDVWLHAERRQLRYRALRIAESVLRDTTNPDQLIEAAERVLTIDASHEGACRALMNVHTARSERGLAIQAYSRCRAALADTVGALPSPQTQTLLQQILGHAHSQERAPPARPQHVNAVALRGLKHDEPGPGSRATRTAPGIHIGVMPFRLIGSPAKYVGLAPGLADEITNALSRFRGILVVSADSLGRFAADHRDEVLIKREFGLDYLLDGSVQQADGKIRVSVQLLDLRANNQVIWARHFDHEIDDLLSLQDEIATRVVAQLDPEILLVETRRNANREPAAATADDLMLRAIPLIGRMEHGPFMQAGQYLADAIALEPDYARLNAWYASWHLFLVGQDWAENPAAITRKATELAERAVVLDPSDAHGLAVNGHVQAFLHRRLPQAISLHNRALTLNPNLAMGWALSGIAHAYAGHVAEAERRIDRYKTLSPFDPQAFFFDAFFVLIHLMKRDYETAVKIGRTVVELNPSFSASYKPYLSALGHLRRDQETAPIRQRLLALERSFTIERFLVNTPLERDCDRMHYAEGLRLAGIPTGSYASRSIESYLS